MVSLNNKQLAHMAQASILIFRAESFSLLQQHDECTERRPDPTCSCSGRADDKLLSGQEAWDCHSGPKP